MSDEERLARRAGAEKDTKATENVSLQAAREHVHAHRGTGLEWLPTCGWANRLPEVGGLVRGAVAREAAACQQLKQAQEDVVAARDALAGLLVGNWSTGEVQGAWIDWCVEKGIFPPTAPAVKARRAAKAKAAKKKGA